MNTITKSIKIAAILMICGLGSLIHAMEKVTLVSSDERSFTVDRSIAEQSGTLKNYLKYLKSEGADLDAVVPLTNVDANTLETIIGILKRVEKIAPRAIDGQQSPYKIQSVVDSFLGGGAGGASFDEIKNIVLAANYLDIPFLINAAARSLVRRDSEQAQNIVQTKDFDTIPEDLHPDLQKHLALMNAGVTKEYSIADLIEEQPAKIKLDSRGELDLSGLEITDLYGFFEYINPEIKSKILILNFSENQLANIPANVFQGLDNLTYLNLSENKLESIPENAFLGLNTLKDLRLAENQLTSIPANAFQGLNALQSLNLYANRLASIPANAFQGLNNLQELYLSGNWLTSLPANVFQGLNNLQELSLAANQLRILPANVFQGLNNLRELYLNKNKLTGIPANAFLGLNTLERLDFSFNKLKSIQENAFQGLNTLKRLSLDANLLDERQKRDIRKYFRDRGIAIIIYF